METYSVFLVAYLDQWYYSKTSCFSQGEMRDVKCCKKRCLSQGESRDHECSALLFAFLSGPPPYILKAAEQLISGADPGFWSGGPAEFFPGGRGLSPKFAQNRGFPLELPENCMILGGWAPKARYWI